MNDFELRPEAEKNITAIFPAYVRVKQVSDHYCTKKATEALPWEEGHLPECPGTIPETLSLSQPYIILMIHHLRLPFTGKGFVQEWWKPIVSLLSFTCLMKVYYMDTSPRDATPAKIAVVTSFIGHFFLPCFIFCTKPH